MSNPEQIQNNQHENKEPKNQQPESIPKDTYQQLMEEGKQVLDNLHLIHYNEANIASDKHIQPSPSFMHQNVKQTARMERQSQFGSQNGRELAMEEDSRKEPNENLQQITKKSSKFFGCNCLKSRCTKNYCQCFTQGRKCNELCKCIGCQNQGEVEKRYRPNIEAQEGQRICNCKKSNCLKKYCECYNSGLKCNSNCKCEQCKNREEIGNGDPEEVKEELKRDKSERQIEEINAKIDEISKMVPKEHQHYILSFLDYWLS